MADEKVTKDDTSKPDKKQQGWPFLSDQLCVDPSYYDQFAPEARPKFAPGAMSGSEITAQQAELARLSRLTGKVRMVTVFNPSTRPLTLTIPGRQTGQAIEVTLPPFAVLCAPDNALPLGHTYPGTKGALVRLASPVGDCRRDRTIMVDGIPMESCDFCDCPHHPLKGFAHAVIEAQRSIGVLGEPCTMNENDPRDPKRTNVIVTYTPPFKDTVREIKKIPGIDPRTPVLAWANSRINALNEREMAIQTATSQGRAVQGR